MDNGVLVCDHGNQTGRCAWVPTRGLNTEQTPSNPVVSEDHRTTPELCVLSGMDEQDQAKFLRVNT